jgi:LmbE family N-acetylglucosaminyl deacetylase
MNNSKKILVIAAHPDDEILGCGATLYKYLKEGSQVKIVILGEGSTGRFPLNEINSDKAKFEIEERYGFSFKALNLLGIDKPTFYHLPCGRFDQIPLIDIGKIIESEISQFKPTILFTHSSKDVNFDHQKTFQATLQATRPKINSSLEYIFSYEVSSSSEWRYIDCFKPNYFVKISSEELLMKIKALNEYQSEVGEFPFPRSEEGIRTLAKYRGMQCAWEAAEAFELVRGVI